MSKRKQYELIEHVIDEEESDVSKKMVLDKYDISSDGTYNTDVLLHESDLNDEYIKKKSSKTGDNTILDAAVFDWYKELSQRGDVITGVMIKEQALLINQNMNNIIPNFKEIRKQWIDAVEPYIIKGNSTRKNLYICQYHFDDTCFFKQSTKIWRDGVKVTIPRKRLQLKKNAVPSIFNASNGWLHRFKKRHGLQISKEIESNETINSSDDPLSTPGFSDILKAKIESENLNLDNIYNADETGIYWRLLTASTLAQRLEVEDYLRRKELQDRITILFCVNSTGSHQVPLLTIGRLKIPRCLNALIPKESKEERLLNLESLGVIYAHQDCAWMDRNIFLLWFKETFIPQVLEHQRTTGITGKVVLLLKNTLSHSTLDALNAINENFEVIFFPPTEASLQPLDQGLIASTIELYKTNYLRRLLLSETSDGVTKFLKEFNFRECFGMLSFAWDGVKSSTIQRAWKPLLGKTLLLKKVEPFVNMQDPLSTTNPVVNERESPTDFLSFPDEIFDQVCELLSKLGYSEEKSKKFLLKWFEDDHKENEDDQESLPESDINIKPEFVSCDSEIMDEIEEDAEIFENSQPSEVTSSEALKSIEKFKNWVKSCSECLPKHLDYIKELENLIKERTTIEISENKVYTSL